MSDSCALETLLLEPQGDVKSVNLPQASPVALGHEIGSEVPRTPDGRSGGRL